MVKMVMAEIILECPVGWVRDAKEDAEWETGL